MRYRIIHVTTYQYSAPVKLRPNVLRLCPRNDGTQWLQAFDCTIEPTPKQQTYFLDANGNTCLKISFNQAIESLKITTKSDVLTTRENPFDYLMEPWALQFPIDYPSSLAVQLRPYWELPLGWGVDDAIAPEVIALAHDTMQAVNNNVSLFLTQLTQYIPQHCAYEQRLQGDPYPAAVTLNKRIGTCRDFTVLFMAVCRAVGLASRFVSGYQEGDLAQGNHDLHAWAEVYVPGGGWRGFDPTLGLAVGDRHVAIAAAADPKQAAPVSGTLQPAQQVDTMLETSIQLKALEESR